MVKLRNLALFLILVNLPAASGADVKKIERAYLQGQISKIEKVKLLGYRLFAPDRLPDIYKSDINEPIKCGTRIVADLRNNLSLLSSGDQDFFNKVLQRPATQSSYLSPDGIFKLHYDDTGPQSVPDDDINQNGIPDYIEEAGRVMDNSYSIEIDSLHYNSPPVDNGASPEIDVYFQNLNSAYGYTEFENQVPNPSAEIWTSYIILDNDYAESVFNSNGLDGLRVTGAHELFHVIQLGYNWRDMDFYFYEMSSTWMEDRVYDEINDYYAYLPSFLHHTYRPLTYSNNNYEYGSALFLKFVEENYSEDIIRLAWENISDINSMDALEWAFNDQGIDFATAFNQFAVWNYFTGERSIAGSFFEEAEFYPTLSVTNNIPFDTDTTIAGSAYYLSHNYFRLVPQSSGNVTIMQKHETSNNFRTGIIFEEPVIKVISDINPQSIENLGTVSDSSSFILVATNTEIPVNLALSLLQYPNIQYQYNLSKQTIIQNYLIFPSPYVLAKHNILKFKLDVPKDAHLQSSILTETGRTVQQYQLGEVARGANVLQIPWDGTDEHGNKMPTGVYLCLITGDNVNILNKFVVIRE